MPNETLIQIGEPILFLTHPSSRSSWNITLLSSSTLLLCCASMVRCAACGCVRRGERLMCGAAHGWCEVCGGVRCGERLMCGGCITSTKTKGWRTCRDVRRTCRTRWLGSRASHAAPHAGLHYWLCDILTRALAWVRQLYIHSFKVHIFWEGHKNFRNLPLTFDCMYCSTRGRFRKILWPSQN